MCLIFGSFSEVLFSLSVDHIFVTEARLACFSLNLPCAWMGSPLLPYYCHNLVPASLHWRYLSIWRGEESVIKEPPSPLLFPMTPCVPLPRPSFPCLFTRKWEKFSSAFLDEKMPQIFFRNGSRLSAKWAEAITQQRKNLIVLDWLDVEVRGSSRWAGSEQRKYYTNSQCTPSKPC